ncbi:putative inactive serine/threonine-protein kinase bub1 isoform X1 [Senna tora]|uniref:Putative inactive serine/threonine-protein kinase bub1 isoform X1 n=1 Tax=Senna tora TaxID=362788 RepID=A0A834U0C8_9FABA|nr:putative inactive serine/threonine-protein kinase bub1 isoform X1 [Senna tora]
MATDNLLSSLFSDIDTYSGKDPLLPWLRGIRKMKDTLSPASLNEKLPGFLQKCAKSFESDRRYRNDMRYIRVWLHLMDFVDDPRSLLKIMEVKQIGTKRCQFYQAYALYYEKNKRYEEAEKMYHLGVKNLAEPMEELHRSYEQFLHRMERKNSKKIQVQEVKASRRPLSSKNIPHGNNTEEKNEACGDENVHKGPQIASSVAKSLANERHVETIKDERKRFRDEHTVVGKFVGTAMVGKSEAENACHNGLVDPTINTKEAMNAIYGMFREPLEDVPIARKSHRKRSKENDFDQNGLDVFVDESLNNGITPSASSSSLQQSTEASQSHQEPLQIYIDDEGRSETSDINDEQSDVRNLSEDFTSSTSRMNAFVFPRPQDLPSENSGNVKFREDTVVCRFVGSTILDEPVVENVCHHGLVDPTINMKEAMDDINNMFGEPMDFVRRKRSKKQDKAPECNNTKESVGFSILVDDDMEHQRGPPPPKLAGKSTKSDLFEPTLHTKEAMDDINKMFNMPLNF